MLTPLAWHRPTWQKIVELNKAKKLSHALLLTANNKVAASYFIQSLAAQILCANNDLDACGECKSCLLFQAGSHPDLLSIGLEEKSKQIKIDQIRKIIHFDHQTAQLAGSKLIVIEPVEAMNMNAANALLKSLEEPSKDTFFLLATTKPSQIMPTIRSRCQLVHLQPPTQFQAEQWLAQTAIPNEQAAFWLFLAQNDPIKAASLFETQDYSVYQHFVNDLIHLPQQGSLVSTAREIEKRGIEIWLNFMQSVIAALLKKQMVEIPLPEFIQPFTILLTSPKFSVSAYYFLDQLNLVQKQRLSQSNPNELLMIESLLSDWVNLTQ